MKKIKMDYNFYLGPEKLRPKELKARSVTYRHLVSLRASSPFGDIVKSRCARGTREETQRGVGGGGGGREASATRSRVLARLAPLGQIGELARRLAFSARWIRKKG